MAGGKQTPRKRPVQAPKQRAATPRRRQGSGRVLLAAAAVVLLVAVGIGVGVALAGTSGSSSSSLKHVSTLRTLLRGIPQHGNVLGSPSAPVTLVEYVDMQCPYCDAFEKQVFPELVHNYIRPGTVKLVVRPLAFIGPDSVRGRNAVIAAGGQNRFFNLMELIYFNQGTENTGWLSESTVDRAATATGVDVERFRRGPELDGRGRRRELVRRAGESAGRPLDPHCARGTKRRHADRGAAELADRSHVGRRRDPADHGLAARQEKASPIA
jgi:hypothetical protein